MFSAIPSALAARPGAVKLINNTRRTSAAALHVQVRAWATSRPTLSSCKHPLRFFPAASLGKQKLVPQKRSKACLSLRSFSTSLPLASAPETVNTPPPIKDETHPSLYYHLFDDAKSPQPLFALSFIQERPSSQHSKTILGWLPAAASGDGEENGLNDFRENSAFLNILHESIKANILDDEIWTNGAIQAQSGWMHIFDQRNPPPLGRIPEPDDIIASIRVEEGRILPDTYSPMPTYRLATADGVCTLTDTLHQRLAETLRRQA